ncbi:hypothetical protein [Halobellus marinus]|jgi:hypothetical protein|uniref:hypothetical protein n=1 Tax=Halobellus TaxID=1073986 RepID=UPI0028A90965|nr:hypothetical protein [Halobellus sp. DFY28]
MGETTYETIDTLVESVQEDVADPDLVFKLRTARQLLLLLQEREDAGRQVLDEVEIGADTRERLERLGYLE